MRGLSDSLVSLEQFPLLRCGCKLVAVFLFSACQIGGAYAPWGLAAVGWCGMGWDGLAGCCGAILGALAFFDFQTGLRYGATAILILCGNLTFRGSEQGENPWFSPLMNSAMFFIVQSVYLIGRGYGALLLCVCGVLCTGLCSFLFQNLSLTGMEQSARRISSAKAEAAAFHALYDSFFSGTETPKPENPSVLFDRAAEQVCRDCTLRTLCWQSDYSATYDAFNDACTLMLQRGRAQPEDFPGHFSNRCIHFAELLSAINSELYAFLLRRQYQKRLQSAQVMARQQYAQIGDLLGDVLPVAKAGHEPLRHYRVGSALYPKEGEAVCGDHLDSFRVHNTLYLLLADGMGSGDAAHAEAAMTIRLLRQFLTAGIAPLSALRTLNSAMHLRGQSGGGYTTIDLLSLSLATGEGTLYKYGAADSYMKTEGNIHVLGARSLPAGLDDTEQLPGRAHICPEDRATILLVSDGVTAAGEDTWLQKLLLEDSGSSPDALCARILSQARARSGGSDDCAAIAVTLEKAELHSPKNV